VISGDRVSKVENAISSLNVSNWLRVLFSGCEERRIGNIGRLRVPSVELA